jgi:TfoX/Sxy family transcriptional regulator of competence genes
VKLRSSELTFGWADGKLVVKTKKQNKTKQNQKTPKTRKKQKNNPRSFPEQFWGTSASLEQVFCLVATWKDLSYFGCA